MSSNLKNCLEKLKIVAKIKNPDLRKKVLLHIADKCLYKALNEIAVNTVSRKIPFSKNTKQHLRKHAIHIEKLAKGTSNSRKQRQLVVQSGGFLPYIIPAVLGILSALIK